MSSSGLVLVTNPPFDLLADWFGFSYCTIRSSLVVPSIDFTVQARIQYSLILFMWYILYILFNNFLFPPLVPVSCCILSLLYHVVTSSVDIVVDCY